MKRMTKQSRKQVMVAFFIIPLILAIYAVIEYYIVMNQLAGFKWEVAFMEWISVYHSQGLNRLFQLITASVEYFSIIPVGVVFTWLWRNNEKITARLLFLSTTIAPILSIVLKDDISRPRPTVFKALVFETSASFPSGHTLMALGTYGFLSYILWKHKKYNWSVFSGLWCLPIAFSRVYLGVHYPTDVLGSMIVGATFLIVLIFLDWNLETSYRDHLNVQLLKNSTSFAKRTLSSIITAIAFVIILLPSIVALIWALPDVTMVKGIVFSFAFIISNFGLLTHDIWFVSKYGGSIGHRMMGLKMIDCNSGNPISRNQSVIRWCLGTMYKVFIIAGIMVVVEATMVYFRKDKRHLRDIMSDTMLVED